MSAAAPLVVPRSRTARRAVPPLPPLTPSPFTPRSSTSSTGKQPRKEARCSAPPLPSNPSVSSSASKAAGSSPRTASSSTTPATSPARTAASRRRPVPAMVGCASTFTWIEPAAERSRRNANPCLSLYAHSYALGNCGRVAGVRQVSRPSRTRDSTTGLRDPESHACNCSCQVRSIY